MIIKRRNRQVPGLNTASLPDLIFSVLFFFIIVTHMRQEEVKVKYRVPEGRELSKLAKKSSVIHIYIGRLSKNSSDSCIIQADDQLVNIDQLIDYLAERRNSLSPEDAQQMTVAIAADRSADMKTIMEVKQALRRAELLKCRLSEQRKQANIVLLQTKKLPDKSSSVKNREK